MSNLAYMGTMTGEPVWADEQTEVRTDSDVVEFIDRASGVGIYITVEQLGAIASAVGVVADPYLDVAALAARLGVQRTTVHKYQQRAEINRHAGTVKPGDLPEPDVIVGIRPAWLRSTIEAWEAARPGPTTEAARAARRENAKRRREG